MTDIKKIVKRNLIALLVVLLEMAVIYVVFALIYHKIPNGLIRTLMLIVNSYNYSFLFVVYISLLFMIAFYLVSKIFHLDTVSIRIKIWKMFYKIVFILSAIFLIISWYNNDDLRVKNYNIHIDKNCEKKDVKIAMMADMHIGAGTRKNILDKVKKIVDDEKPDCIILAGDIFDHTTSENDLSDFGSVFSSFDCPIYSANGNHEKDCYFDYRKIYDNIGVNVINDKVEYFDGIAIIGKDNDTSIDVKYIIEKNNIDTNVPKILIKHKPKGYADFQDDIDIVFSGHIHGPRYPFCKWMYDMTYDLSYGIKKFKDMFAIVTSGVSVWGHHIRMSSHSEVVIVNVDFR